jgi:transposase-like protein
MSLDETKLMNLFMEIINSLPTYCIYCCGKTTSYKELWLRRCTKRTCGKRFSLLKGTPFHNSHIQIITILKIIRMWCCKVHLTDIAELLDLNRKVVSKVISKMKKPLINNFYERLSLNKIGGEDVIVEIDESKFGKVKYHRGHRVEGVWVFGMVERTPSKRIIFIPIDNRKRETLEALLLKHVDSRSIIHSDCWRAYDRLCEIFFQHKKVNHSENFVDSINGIHTNTIEGNWCGVKSQIVNTHKTRKFVEIYLIRYTLRRNYKEKMFEMLLKYLF